MKRMGLATFGLAVAMVATAANAFILTSRVSDSKGKAIECATVSIASLDLSATTDGVGKFTLRDTPMFQGISQVSVNPGFVHVADGVLSFVQSNSNPVQVQIYDAVGIRVFSAGFSYGSMFTNGLSRDHHHVLRGVAAYETAEVNIWVPKLSGKSIAWMGVRGLQDNLCIPEMGHNARNAALKHNGSNFSDASGEMAIEYSGSGPHVCYDYKTVDERFPVK